MEPLSYSAGFRAHRRKPPSTRPRKVFGISPVYVSDFVSCCRPPPSPALLAWLDRCTAATANIRRAEKGVPSPDLNAKGTRTERTPQLSPRERPDIGMRFYPLLVRLLEDWVFRRIRAERRPARSVSWLLLILLPSGLGVTP